jgi:hypothetical protein
VTCGRNDVRRQVLDTVVRNKRDAIMIDMIVVIDVLDEVAILEEVKFEMEVTMHGPYKF